MNMTIEALRAFKTAAETGSFTKAAEQSYMTQPAFSRLIASMEKEFSVRLFERSTRRVLLTPAGELCLQRVKLILSTYDLLLKDMETERTRCTGHLRVGYNPVSGPPAFFVEAIRRLGIERPGIRTSLVRAYSTSLVEQVERGELDCALVSSFYLSMHDNLEVRHLQPIFLYALVRKEKPMAMRERVSVCDLVGEPMVFMKDTAPRTRRCILQAFEERGLPPTEAEPVDDLEEMIMRVRTDDVVGISSFCDPNHQYPDVVAVIISEFETIEPMCGRALVWRRDGAQTEVEALNRILDDEARKGSRNGVYPFD